MKKQSQFEVTSGSLILSDPHSGKTAPYGTLEEVRKGIWDVYIINQLNTKRIAALRLFHKDYKQFNVLKWEEAEFDVETSSSIVRIVDKDHYLDRSDRDPNYSTICESGNGKGVYPCSYAISYNDKIIALEIDFELDILNEEVK